MKPYKRMCGRIDPYVYDGIIAAAQSSGKSINEYINNVLADHLKDLVLHGKATNETVVKNNPKEYEVALIARINAAQDAARELRIIGECGIAQSFDQFMMLQNRVTSEVHDQIIRDKLTNGPFIYNDPGSDEADAACKKYEVEASEIGNDGELDALKDQSTKASPAPNGALDVRGAEAEGIVVKDDPDHNQNAPSEAALAILKDLEGLE